MSRIKIVVTGLTTLILFLFSNALQATDTWYSTKAEAFEKALSEGKYVFLFAERDGCGNCKEVKRIMTEEEDVMKILEESYVVWDIKWDKEAVKPNSEARIYINEVNKLEDFKTLPALFIIDPEKPEKSLNIGHGGQNIKKMIALIDIEGRPVTPVSNEKISIVSNKAYISGNNLYVSNTISNEKISVYTVSGQLVTSFIKNGTDATFNTSALSKGVLLLSSSEGWSQKILNR